MGLTALNAHVVVAVPPHERLPGPLPSLSVWLEGGHSDDVLPGVVEVVVVEAGQVGLGVGLGGRDLVREVGGVTGGAAARERRGVVISEISQASD